MSTSCGIGNIPSIITRSHIFFTNREQSNCIRSYSDENSLMPRLPPKNHVKPDGGTDIRDPRRQNQANTLATPQNSHHAMVQLSRVVSTSIPARIRIVSATFDTTRSLVIRNYRHTRAINDTSPLSRRGRRARYLRTSIRRNLVLHHSGVAKQNLRTPIGSVP